jgi:iron complex outermembrane receptor protein
MVITREAIAALPVAAVADVLRLLSSVDVRARGERGVQSDFAVRGAGFGQMLVLVDGIRLNDPQSGHHNGDIPIPLGDVERIEILPGAGSSLFGADAWGGTVNVITRRAAEPSLRLHGGSFSTAGGQAQAGLSRGNISQTLGFSFDRSAGFMYDRDFDATILRSRTSFRDGSAVSVAFLRKEFGANNFYGGNSPSREWTNQTLLSAYHRLAQLGGWTVSMAGSYRTHGDRFVFNQVNPQLSDNRHRTHALIGAATLSRKTGSGTLAAGVEGGGDWIRSSNLGDHELARGSAFGEWRQPLGGDMHVDAAVRVDRYSEFGTSWNPSIGAGWWPSASVRLRASAGRAFRVPTFTERYYSDPANLARSEVGPESAWAGEAGVDVVRGAWLLQATWFGRAEKDVIDWLRPSTAERWQTYNVRAVDATGVEAGVRGVFGRGFVMGQVTWLDLDAPAVTQLSKYALDYASRSAVAAALVPLPAGFMVAPRVEYRRRERSGGGQEYVLIDARVTRRLTDLVELAVDGMNLLDRSYQEIAGVPMPGATFLVSLRVGR